MPKKMSKKDKNKSNKTDKSNNSDDINISAESFQQVGRVLNEQNYTFQSNILENQYNHIFIGFTDKRVPIIIPNNIFLHSNSFENLLHRLYPVSYKKIILPYIYNISLARNLDLWKLLEYGCVFTDENENIIITNIIDKNNKEKINEVITKYPGLFASII
jgi:hypothetical protein